MPRCDVEWLLIKTYPMVAVVRVYVVGLLRDMNLKSKLDDALEEDEAVDDDHRSLEVNTYCQSECLILVWQTGSEEREEKEKREGFEVKRGSESWWGSGQPSSRASAQVLGR